MSAWEVSAPVSLRIIKNVIRRTCGGTTPAGSLICWPPPAGPPEDVLERTAAAEQIGERREDIVEAAKAAHMGAGKPFVAVLVVQPPLLRIAEHVVGLCRLFERGLGFLPVVRVAVGVILDRQLAEGLFQTLRVGVPAHPQNLVIVAFRHRKLVSV